jgi:hypothetical protein
MQHHVATNAECSCILVGVEFCVEWRSHTQNGAPTKMSAGTYCYKFSVAVKKLPDAVPLYAVKRRRGPAALFDLAPNLAMCAY